MSQSDFVTRGQALVNSGQYQEAVKVCRLGLLGRPTTVEGRVVLGQALLALKRYDEVLAEMRVALELDHTSITAQVLKGEALLKKGDAEAAIAVLQVVRTQAPTDPKIDSLLTEAQRSVGKAPLSASHPSVGFVGKPAGVGENTRHYPSHAVGDDDDEIEPPTHGFNDEPSTQGFSKDQPTSVSTPGSKKRTSSRKNAIPNKTPSPNMLAVGDKSGTVEVDPELDGIELDGDDDFGEAVSPPSSRAQDIVENQRGRVMSARRAALPAPSRKKNKVEHSSVELEDDDVLELDASETLLPANRPQGPGPVTRARNAVNKPSGPLEGHTATARGAPAPASTRPTAHEPAVQPPQHLAQMIANAPHVMEVARPQLSMTMRGNPGGPPRPNPIAAALPTMAAQPPNPLSQLPPGAAQTAIGVPSGGFNPNAARPTLAISPDPGDLVPGTPGWARATVAAGHPPGLHPPPGGLGMQQLRAEEPTSRPGPVNPGISSLMEPSAVSALDPGPSSVAQILEPSHSSARALKTGMRKGRSRVQIAIWLIIGALVIAGGVFVGFKFRAMRLDKKIADTRDIALGLAKADTWKGLVRSRDRLAGIAQASPTPDNRASLARTRAQIAFEFGDGMPDAKKAVDTLSGQSGIDVEIAGAYLALAQNDTKAALAAAGRATQLAADDPAALYVSGQAELLSGDPVAAIKHLEKAVEKEGRPLYRIALARAFAENTEWAAAIAALDPPRIKAWFDALDPDTTRELTTSGIELDKLAQNHPGVAIARAQIVVASGQLGTKGKELRAPVQDVVAEGTKTLNDQIRGVSPAQVAFGHLALSMLDFQLLTQTSQADFRAALAVGLDDQEFAERAIEVLYFTNDLAGARAAAERALQEWPNSRRARLALARVVLAQGKPIEGMDAIAKLDVDKYAGTLAMRGQLRFAMGDLPNAKDDFDKALEKSNKNLEAALVGRSWIDLATGDVDSARTRMRSRYSATATPAITTVWAAILRAGGVPSEREDARAYLEKVVAGAPSVELVRAQLELARMTRELGDPKARELYTKVIEVTGNPEIKLEVATYLIEFQDPPGGRESIDELLKNAGPQPPPDLVLEAARAHMLVGDHKGAAELLEQADKLQNVTRWKYDRERGRLSLRKADFNGAALSLEKALDGCGSDTETFLLAAEVAAVDDKHAKLADHVKQLIPQRLKETPESKIVSAKLLGGRLTGTTDDAKKARDEAGKLYEAARTALEKASPRRRAQAHLGRAIVAYNGQDDPTAIDAFDLAVTLNPSLYEAYVYLADIQKEKEPKKALARAQTAVQSNPDNADAYVMLGSAAHKLGDKKTLAEAITRVGALAPNSEQLKALQQLR